MQDDYIKIIEDLGFEVLHASGSNCRCSKSGGVFNFNFSAIDKSASGIVDAALNQMFVSAFKNGKDAAKRDIREAIGCDE